MNNEQINFQLHMECLPTPYLINEDGAFIYMNYAYLKIAGFPSLSYGYQKGYCDYNCEAKEYAEDFMLRDSIVLREKQPMQFIACYKYFGDQFQCFVVNKFLDRQNPNLVCSLSTEITNEINPFIAEILSLHSENQRERHDKSFWYRLNNLLTPNSLLTKREITCISFLIRSYTNSMIAEKLCISKRTVDHHFEHIRSKLGVRSKAEIIEICLRLKLLPLQAILS